MTTHTLQHDYSRLVAAYPNLIWRKAQATRRRKQRHAFTLEADRRYVAELCINKTCAAFDCARTTIMCRYRLRVFTDPRHVAMTVAYELSGLSSMKLGKLFNRGHDMILWAQKRVNEAPSLRIQADKVIRVVKRELKGIEKRAARSWKK